MEKLRAPLSQTFEAKRARTCTSIDRAIARSNDPETRVPRFVRSCSSEKVLEGLSLRYVVRQENLPARLNRAYRARTCSHIKLV